MRRTAIILAFVAGIPWHPAWALTDSAKVTADDAFMDAAAFRTHYNYGGKTTVYVGTSGSYEDCRILFDAYDIAGVITEDGLTMDSVRLYFKVELKSPGGLTFSVYKTVRWWGEGKSNGASDTCGADWIDSQHGGGTAECVTQYAWGTAGCDNTTTDREAVACGQVTVDAGYTWFYVTLADSIAQGLYDNRDTDKESQTNHTGFVCTVNNSNSKYISVYATEFFGPMNDPYFMFYWPAPPPPVGEGTRRRLIQGMADEN